MSSAQTVASSAIDAMPVLFPRTTPVNGALRDTRHLGKAGVFEPWDEMSKRRDCSNTIVEAEAKSASGRRVKAPPLEGMEWMVMNKDDAHESLLILIGELLYKNQLLREAIASKDQAIETIIGHLMSAATSDRPCDVTEQLEFVRNTVKDWDVVPHISPGTQRFELQNNGG